MLVRKLTEVLKARSGATAVVALRVERQQRLQPLQRVQRDEAGEAEGQHGDRVDHPVLLFALVDAADRVEAALERAQHR